MIPSARRAELKAFLRARRASLVPEAMGFARGKRRLTPGLRREEIVAMSGVGLTWYTRLEQGRDINVSAEALGRISRALQLSPTDDVYLFALAGVPHASRESSIQLPPTLQGVLDGFNGGPAVVIGPAWDVLMFNSIADTVFGFRKMRDPLWRNQLWRGFVDPSRRKLYVEWEHVMRNVVGIFRMSYASRIGDPMFERLIALLEKESADFVRIWHDRQTQPLNPFVLRLRHPRLGHLVTHSVRFPVDAAPGAVMIVAPAADVETAAKFGGMQRATAS